MSGSIQEVGEILIQNLNLNRSYIISRTLRVLQVNGFQMVQKN